ncbi:hypothetical protein GGI24_002022 [Coemansia furcata]|nr:hypothetical protein GGI24_002022 [Coemansia furcata]
MLATPPTAIPPEEAPSGPTTAENPTPSAGPAESQVSTSDIEPTLPVDTAPHPTPTPLFVNWASTENGPSFSAVAAQGHIRMGGSIPRSTPAKRPMYTKYPLIQFSTLGLLSDRPLNVDEPPVKVMANAPVADHCCIYVLPTDITAEEFGAAVADASKVTPMSNISWPHVKVSPLHGLGTIGVENAEELAILSEATIRVRGQPLIPKHIVQYKDSYAYILITRLAITSFAKRTKDIAEVLSPYGKIVDIIFERQERTIHDHIKVILDRTNDKSIPCRLMISSTEAVLSGRKVEVFCNYCRTSGHYKDKCPIRPGNKKHAASIEISMDETTPASNLPNNSASSSRSILKKSRARNMKTAKSTKSAQPTASNKWARHDGNPDPRSPITQTAKEVPMPTSAASTALPFISGAANFGPG